MMTTLRWWSTVVVKELLLVVLAVAVAALTVECNQTLVLAVTGGVTMGDDGVATKKTWAQVREVVAEEWGHQHNVQDIKDFLSSVAKDAKLKAQEFTNKKNHHHTEEMTYEAANEQAIKVEAKDEYDNLKKASDNLQDGEVKAQLLTSTTEGDDDDDEL